MMKKVDLYPSTIYLDNIYNNNFITEALKVSKDLSKNDTKLNDCSVRLGWQSTKELYNIPLFSKLADAILIITKKNILQKNIQPFISSMWLNVQGTNGFNHTHVHSGGWYSGVFYLKCCEKSGNITFTDPRPGAEMSLYHQFTNGEIQTISPKPGDLILFPSWLPHLVEPNYSNDDRISVAFNIELNI